MSPNKKIFKKGFYFFYINKTKTDKLRVLILTKGVPALRNDKYKNNLLIQNNLTTPSLEPQKGRTAFYSVGVLLLFFSLN